MKFRFIIAVFLIIIIGWISVFHFFGKIEKSNILKSHLCQEQLQLINSFRDLSGSISETQNESLLSRYNNLLENHELLLNGGSYSYSGLNTSLPAVKTTLILEGFADISINLDKIGQILNQTSNETSASNASVYELLDKLPTPITAILTHYESKSESNSSWKLTYMFLLAFFTIAAVLISLALFKKEYLTPVVKLDEFSKELTSGIYNSDRHSKTNAQFSKLNLNLNKIGKRVQDVILFVDQIGKGNMEVEFQTEGESDHLGTSLLHLKEELRKVKIQDEERRWANEGLTEFNNIIRANNDDVKGLAQKLISETVKYVSANQGAIFQVVDEEDEQCLELLSAYAWDREKFVDKKLDLKSNMIGQAVFEREYMLIKDIPNEFVNITSGLGEATPQSLIILPLIFNDVCCGALELASFTDFDEKTVLFLNQLSENIASAILNITGNAETKKLLEESQAMTEQMKMQEEELRQNEEELEASQESLSRKLDEATREMKNQLKNAEAEKMKNIAILEGSEDGVIMFKGTGAIEFINSTAAELFCVDKIKMLGKKIGELIPTEIVQDKEGDRVYFTGIMGNDQRLPITLRTEILMEDIHGDELSLLVTLSKGKVDNDVTFAFFIQKISVELF